MNRYGQSITWSTPTAPHPFTGVCTSYSEREGLQEQLIDDEVGDNTALVLHSKKTDISFDARVTDGSTDFLDLSAGAALTLSGFNSGIVLCRRAVERWVLEQPKTASIQATHYPDIAQATPAEVGTDLDAFTPDQSALSIVYPGDVLIYGTYGISHASGVVHGLTIEQILQITEDEPSPVGTILGAASHGYMRRIELDLLATGSKPAVGSVLTLTGAPSHGSDYRITSSEKKFATKRGMMYAVAAVWISPFTA